MIFSNELLSKYNMTSLEESRMIFGDNLSTELTFYQTFLIQTDHIPNKIIESLVEDLADVNLLNFLEIFTKFLSAIKEEYKEVLQCRKFAREEVNRLSLLLEFESVE